VLALALVEAAGVQADLGDTSAAAGLIAEALDLTRSGEFRLLEVEAVEGMAWVLAATGDASRAARMLGAAEAMREATEGGMPPSRRRRLETTEATARAALGVDGFAAASSAGRALGREVAVSEALALARGLATGEPLEQAVQALTLVGALAVGVRPSRRPVSREISQGISCLSVPGVMD
jgi:hypothetical protein